MADLFISYSRRDGDFVRKLHSALSDRGRDVWVDWEDIPPAFMWRDELATGMSESDVVVFVISPDSLESPECALELEHAISSGKRIIPLMLRQPDGQEVPDALAQRNFVFFHEGENGFAKGVDDLQLALDHDAEWTHKHRRMLVRAEDWDKGGRDGALLLRGGDLRQAESDLSGWREGQEPVPTALQREYVAAGRRAAGRRMGGLLLAVLMVLVLSVVLGVLALLERNKAVDRERAAQSRQLAAASILESSDRPELATRLALAGLERERSAPAEQALRLAISQVQSRGVLVGSGHPVAAADIASSHRVVTGDQAGQARVWDPGTGRVDRLPDHPGGVISVVTTADGRRALVSGADGVARMRDLATGRETVMRAPGPLGAGLTDDERTVLGLGGDNDVRLWDSRTGRSVATLPTGPSEVVWADTDRHARVVLVVHKDGRVETWDVRARRRLTGWRVAPGAVQAASIAPDSSWAVVADGTRVPEVRDTRTGRVLHRLVGHRVGVISVAVSFDGRLIATGGYDNRARIWDAATGRSVRELRGHGDSVSLVRFSRDGRRLLTSSPDDTVRVWAVDTGETLAVLRQPGYVGDARFTADGRYVVTAADDGRTRMWEASPGRTLAVLRHRGRIEAATLDPTGRYAASSGPDRLQFAEARTGRVVASDPASLLEAGPTHDMAFDPHRRWWAVADGFGAYVFRLSDGNFVGLHFGGWVNAVSWNRRGDRLAAAADDGTARILDPRAKELAVFRHPGRRVWRAFFTPDGRRLVTLTDEGAVHVWDIASRRQVDQLPGTGRGDEMALSPDGRMVAVTDGVQSARLWRIGTPAGQARTLKHGGFVNAVRFSGDGKRLATASDDGAARVWNVAGGPPLVMRGHLDIVRDVDISPNGRFVLSASDDRTVRLWDAHTGRLNAVFAGHDAPVVKARFSRDGREILTVPQAGAAAVYACDACLPLNELIAQARRLVGRGLSAAERKRYLS